MAGNAKSPANTASDGRPANPVVRGGGGGGGGGGGRGVGGGVGGRRWWWWRCCPPARRRLPPKRLMPFPPRRLASRGSRNHGKREISRKHGLRRKASQRGGPRWW